MSAAAIILLLLFLPLPFAAYAGTIASCQFGERRSHIEGVQPPLGDGVPTWSTGENAFQATFVGGDRVEDVVLTSDRDFGNGNVPWTRTASDYGAHVHQAWREGQRRQVIVLWGPVTEVYAFDTVTNTASVTQQKTGLVKVAAFYVGTCHETGR